MPSNDPICEAPRVCTVCGVELAPQEEHNYNDGICTVCGAHALTEGLEFELDKDTDTYVMVGLGNVTRSTIVVPSTYNGKPVTGIGESAFNGASSGIETIVIPEGVTWIGDYAMFGCYNLLYLTLPSSLRTIGINAIDITHICSYADTEYGNAKYIGNKKNPYIMLLCAANKDITSCEIHEDTRFIGELAFSECSAIEEISIPNGVTSIGWRAFEGCTSLTNVSIPDSVTYVGIAAFKNCTSIAEISLPSSISSLSEGTFGGCTSLTRVDLPDSITHIGGGAFSGCSSLAQITLPDSVTSIKWGALFDNCGSLVYNEYNNVYYIGSKSNPYFLLIGPSVIGMSSYEIHENTKHIEAEAFKGCEGVMSFTIPNGVLSIGEKAFYGCVYLASVDIPDSVTWIDDEAFSGCINLERVELPSGINEINYKTFYGCSDLVSVVIPAGVTSIYGNAAFKECNKLEAVYIADIATWCGIGFGSNGFNTNNFSYNLYLNGELVTELVIPDSVTSIGEYAFYGCSSLTSVTIPDSVTSIGSWAFYRCSNLTSVTIGNSVTSIGWYAFSECSSLTSITIPDSVTSIGDSAFWGCSRLTSVTIGNGVARIESSALYECWDLADIYYSGTEAEWDKIIKHKKWNNNTGNYTLHCSDVDIEK